MKRPAFTLLETVVALAIAVVVMGAALSANRVVQRNAQLAEVKTQQEAILSDTFDLLTLTQNSLRQAASPLPFSTAFAGLGINSTLKVAPYRFRQVDPFQATDPSVIKWCTPADNTCTGIVSTAGPTSGQYTMASALSTIPNGAEVIAVRKTAPVSNQPQIYDFTYLPASGAVATTSLLADNTTNQQDWDFYRRQITITYRTADAVRYAGYSVTVSVWPMIAGQNHQADAVTRTMVFTDY